MTEKYFNFTGSPGKCNEYNCFDTNMQCWRCDVTQKWFVARVVALHRAHLLLSFSNLSVTPIFENSTYIFYGQNYEVHLYRREFPKNYSYIVSAWPGHHVIEERICRLSVAIEQ